MPDEKTLSMQNAKNAKMQKAFLHSCIDAFLLDALLVPLNVHALSPV
jgi:hypothetical protein